MRIAVIAGYASSLVNFRGPLMRAMQAAGHEVVALSPPDDPNVAGRLRDMGIPYIPFLMRRKGLHLVRDLRALNTMRHELRRIQPDSVLFSSIKPVIFGSIAARLAGVPRIYSIITGLGYVFDGGGLRRRLLYSVVKDLYVRSLRLNRAVFFQNPDDLDFFVRRGIVPAEKAVLTNGSGIDLDHFAAAPPCAPESCAGPSFLLVARLIREKGIAEYAEAARSLKAKYPEARFRLLGPFESGPGGIDERELGRWKEEGIIEYIGFTDDVRPYLHDTSVYVLPSFYREGTPRSVLEAMSVGRPVVTTDAPGCRETVVEGANGFLVPVNDVPALARAMERFLLDPSLIAPMGAASRRLAEERFDVRKVNRIIMERMGL